VNSEEVRDPFGMITIIFPKEKFLTSSLFTLTDYLKPAAP